MKSTRRSTGHDTWSDRADDGAATVVGAVIVLLMIAFPLMLL